MEILTLNWVDASQLAGTTESPSALFARRLMNYCSAETEEAVSTQHQSRSSTPPPARSKSSLFSPAPTPIHTTFTSPWPWSQSEYELNEEDEHGDLALQESMEELEEGLDVLMILERAFEKTIKAHVVPTPSDKNSTAAEPSRNSRPTQETNEGTTALLSGSSTALLAVLDHAPHISSRRSKSPSPMSRSASPSPPLADRLGEVAHSESGAVLKIAHLGDCMGMLVRGEEIVWRSEEMWWSFNTPVQLGPLSPSKPSTHARTFTLPIQEDDILILASDGLSDNLWDEEVLDEVIRFKRSFLTSASTPVTNAVKEKKDKGGGLLGRRTMAGMLSEALCSRARRVSERRPRGTSSTKAVDVNSADEVDELEVPFGRRAREQGKVFRGGKVDGKLD